MYPYAEADTYVEAQYLGMPDIVGFSTDFLAYSPNRKKIVEIKNDCCYYSIVDKLITEAVLT